MNGGCHHGNVEYVPTDTVMPGFYIVTVRCGTCGILLPNLGSVSNASIAV